MKRPIPRRVLEFSPNSAQNRAAETRHIALLERLAIGVEAVLAELRNRGAPAVPNSKLMVAQDLAELLDVDLRTLRAMRRAGDVPAGFLLGRSPRWRRVEIDAWLAKQR